MSNAFIPSRRLHIIPLCIVALSFLLPACKRQDLTIPPAIAEFTSSGAGYFIQDDTGSVYHIPVGVTAVSNKARNLNYKIIHNTATEGQQYNITGGTKGTVTVPADSAIGFINVKGIFAGYSSDPGRVDTLVFVLTGGDAPTGSLIDTFTLTMQQYCPVILADLLGEYDNCVDVYAGTGYGPYTVMITGTATSATSAKLVVTNFSNQLFGPYASTDHAMNPGTTIDIDWSDPANFTTKVETQPLYMDPTYGQATISNVTNGTFSSCQNTFELNYTVTVSAGSFGQFSTYLQR